MAEKYVILFDGYCGLCNRAIDFLIRKDKQRKFRFSPLQGEFIKTLNVEMDKNNLKTLYVYDGQNIYSKTRAWQKITYELGGGWRVLSLCSRSVPIFILDFFYNLIAKHRYKIFGKRSDCRVPTLEERSLFID